MGYRAGAGRELLRGAGGARHWSEALEHGGTQVLPRLRRLTGGASRLPALRRGLPPTAARIADFILANAAEVVHMSVTEVAERAGASEGSVVGLCQQLGAPRLPAGQDRAGPRPGAAGPVHPRGSDARRRSRHRHRQDLRSRRAGAAGHAEGARHRGDRARGGRDPHAQAGRGLRHRQRGADRRGCQLSAAAHRHRIARSWSTATCRRSAPRSPARDVAVLTISHSGSTIETVTATRLAKEAGATDDRASPISAVAAPGLCRHRAAHHGARDPVPHRGDDQPHRAARRRRRADRLPGPGGLRRAVATISKTFDVLSTKRF